MRYDICTCGCHDSNIIIHHVTPCCHMCELCNQRILLSAWEEHKKEHQKEMTENDKELNRFIFMQHFGINI